jgi:hypothetical protein
MHFVAWLGSAPPPDTWDLAPGQDPALYFAIVALVMLALFAPLAVILLRMYGRIVSPAPHALEHAAPDPPPPVLLSLPPVTGVPATTTYPSAPAMFHAHPRASFPPPPAAAPQPPWPIQPPPSPVQPPAWYVHRGATLESPAPPVPLPAPLSSLQVVFDEPAIASAPPAAPAPAPLPPPADVARASLPPQPPPRVLPPLDFDVKPTTMLDRPLPPVSDTRPDVTDFAFEPTVAASPDQIPQSRVPSRPVPPPAPPGSRRPMIRATAPTPPRTLAGVAPAPRTPPPPPPRPPARTPPPPKPPSLWGQSEAVLDPNATAQLTPVTPTTAPVQPRTLRIDRR